jgi:glycogen debranching enzyme
MTTLNVTPIMNSSAATSSLWTPPPAPSVTTAGTADPLIFASTPVTPANRAAADVTLGQAIKVTKLEESEPECSEDGTRTVTETSDTSDANEVLKLTSLITELMRMSANKTSLTGKLAQAHRENAELRLALDVSNETNRQLQKEVRDNEERFREQQGQAEVRVAEYKRRAELDETYFQQEIESAQERERQTRERGQLDLKAAQERGHIDLKTAYERGQSELKAVRDDHRHKLLQHHQQLQLEQARFKVVSTQHIKIQEALNDSKSRLVKWEAIVDRLQEAATSSAGVASLEICFGDRDLRDRDLRDRDFRDRDFRDHSDRDPDCYSSSSSSSSSFVAP